MQPRPQYIRGRLGARMAYYPAIDGHVQPPRSLADKSLGHLGSKKRRESFGRSVEPLTQKSLSGDTPTLAAGETQLEYVSFPRCGQVGRISPGESRSHPASLSAVFWARAWPTVPFWVRTFSYCAQPPTRRLIPSVVNSTLCIATKQAWQDVDMYHVE